MKKSGAADLAFMDWNYSAITTIQNSFQLYLHSFIISKEEDWR